MNDVPCCWIQSHLKKLFAGIHSVEFTEDSASLTAMCSIAGEVVPLTKPVQITEQVEEWLDVLSNEMRATLTASLEGGLSVLDLQKLPSQILCVAENVYFTQKAHACVERGGAELSSIKQELLDSHAKYTSIETEGQVCRPRISCLCTHFPIQAVSDKPLRRRPCCCSRPSPW